MACSCGSWQRQQQQQQQQQQRAGSSCGWRIILALWQKWTLYLTSERNMSPMKVLLALFSVLSVVTAKVHPSDFFGATNRDVYLDWFGTANYTHVFYTPATADTGVAMHWSIVDDSIHLAVAVRATGWAGFGLAEVGAMPGSDMVLYTAATDSVTDAHVKDELQPITDDCQDWSLIKSRTDGGFLIFEVVRALDTGDSQDRVIVNDADDGMSPHHIISAWGDSEQPLYHGPKNQVRSAVRLFGEPGFDELQLFHQTMSTASEGSFDLRAMDYAVLRKRTNYAYFCFSYSDLQAQGVPADVPLHVVGIEPIIDEDSDVNFVHHFVVLGRNDDIRPGEKCDERTKDWIDMAAVWTPGQGPMTFPSNVGGPIGTNSGGFLAYQLEIHYNNPLGIAGAKDNSGVRFYYTSQLREHDMGMLQLGDPFVDLKGVAVGSGTEGLAKHSFDCPRTCSSLALGKTGSITILREFLHMHATGRKIVREQFRNKKLIRSDAFEFFDFDTSGGPEVQQREYLVLPGDSFKTTCFYSPESDTTFGYDSSQEMCIDFVFYYPKVTVGKGKPFQCGYKDIRACRGKWKREKVSSLSDLDRTFGDSNGSCGLEQTGPAGATPAFSVSSASQNCGGFQDTIDLSRGGSTVTLDYTVELSDPSDTSYFPQGTLSVRLTYEGKAWLGFGLMSNPGRMIGGHAVIGLPDQPNGPENPGKYSLDGKTPNQVVPFGESASRTLINATIEQNSKRTILTFTKSLVESDELRIKGNGVNSFMWAHGFNNVLQGHKNRGTFELTLRPCNGAASQDDIHYKLNNNGLSETSPSLFFVHGWLAGIAWGVLAPLAIAASLLRDHIPSKWFPAHKVLNLLVCVMTLAAFVCAVAAQEKSTREGESANHFSTEVAHRSVGLMITIFLTLQVAGGLLRPQKSDPRPEGDEKAEEGLLLTEAHEPRPETIGGKLTKDVQKATLRIAWQRVHKLGGFALLGCASWEVNEGLALYAARFGEKDWTPAFWCVFGGICGVALVLRVYSYSVRKKGEGVPLASKES